MQAPATVVPASQQVNRMGLSADSRASVRCLVAVVLWCCLFTGTLQAAATACPEHFAGGKAPDLIRTEPQASYQELCLSGFAVMHSGKTRTAVYVAHQLTGKRPSQPKPLRRSIGFYAEARLPAEDRAELHHYAGSGFDRGHLAPAADMPDEQSRYESFSLANVVPQVPHHNRGVWAQLEKRVRKLAETHGKVYVITGPVFGSKQQLPGGAVTVPTSLFKVLYTPDSGASAFVADNRADAEVIQIELQQLEEITGIRFFPHNSNSPVLPDQTWDAIWGGYDATVITHDVFSRGR